MILRRTLLTVSYAAMATVAVAPAAVRAEVRAFPGAVGQGARATGGRGGDVYRVTNLDDYDPQREEKIPGSFRHAIRSAEAPRTIVFDVSGAIALHAPLEILKSDLTIAGQTSPGGVTVWGYPTEVSRGRNIIIRYVRFRTGDFHARNGDGGDSSNFNAGRANGLNIGGGCEQVILDHVSVSWGIDETMSVTKCRDVTVQHSIIAESLNNSFHPKGPHGYGSLIRGELTPADQEAARGGFTLYGNLWAHHRARNPSIGGQQSLEKGQSEDDRRRTDVNLINNVIYNWGDQATHRSESGDVRINLVGNYYVAGPAKAAKYFFRENDSSRTELYHAGNYYDFDQDPQHDGGPVPAADDKNLPFRDFGPEDVLRGDGSPFDFLGAMADRVQGAEAAYAAVVAGAGASLWRDAVDQRVVDTLVARQGKLIDSQEEFRGADGTMPGIDDLPTGEREPDFDQDSDGLPDAYEADHGLDPQDPADGPRPAHGAGGYTNLEVYLNSLATAATDGSRSNIHSN